MKRICFFLIPKVVFGFLLLVAGLSSHGALPSSPKTPSSVLTQMQVVLKQYESKPVVTMNFEKKKFFFIVLKLKNIITSGWMHILR